MRYQRRLQAHAFIVTALAFGCSGPTAPSVPLSSGVRITTSPPTKLASIVSAPPFHWRASWAVNVSLPEPIRNRDLSVSVHTRVEQADGRLLAEALSGPRRFEPPGDEGVEAGTMQFSQQVVYDTTTAPPTTSLLIIRVRLSDARGRSEEMTDQSSVGESLCGARGQMGCGGALIAVTGSGVAQPSVTIRFGQQLTFYSPNGSTHNIRSEPHPAHSDCPALNVPEISAGINGSTASFFTPGMCRYHDDNFLGKVTGEVIVLPIGPN
jgi:hypothetical protein